MAELVNLRHRRKQADRAAREAQAAQNRIAFGRGKAEKMLSKAERERAKAALDAKKIEER